MAINIELLLSFSPSFEVCEVGRNADGYQHDSVLSPRISADEVVISVEEIGCISSS